MITKFFLDYKFHEFYLVFCKNYFKNSRCAAKIFFENKNDEDLNNEISILQVFADFVGRLRGIQYENLPKTSGISAAK
jgi:hypothetical protein